MTAYRKLAAASMATSLAFAGVACSGDDVADSLAEQAIESGSDGNVDVDLDSGDGKVTVTDEDGNESEIDVSGTGSASLPDGFPEDLAPPDDVRIVSSSTSTIDGQQSMYVLAEADGQVEQYTEGIKNQLTGAGYEITNESVTSADGGGFATLGAEGDYTVAVTISGDDENTVAISFSVTEPTPAG